LFTILSLGLSTVPSAQSEYSKVCWVNVKLLKRTDIKEVGLKMKNFVFILPYILLKALTVFPCLNNPHCSCML
jgi:hypothetical protein